MADTPPAAPGRKIPVPTPVLIAVVVAVGAGLWLFLRNRKSQAAQQQQAASAQAPPVVLAGPGGGGISSGLLYTILQNLQSQPSATPTGTTTPATHPATTINLAAWQPGVPESQQAWNADLNNISAHYGIPVNTLIAANPQLQNPSRIPTGTLINIPAH